MLQSFATKNGENMCYTSKKMKLDEILLRDRRVATNEGHISVEAQYQHS